MPYPKKVAFEFPATLAFFAHGRQLIFYQFNPHLPDGIAVSRCRFFLAGGGDFISEIRIVFQKFEFREEILRGCDLQVIDSIRALGFTGAVLACQKWNSGDPGIVKFSGGFVEVESSGKIPDSQNGIDIRVVMPALRASKR